MEPTQKELLRLAKLANDYLYKDKYGIMRVTPFGIWAVINKWEKIKKMRENADSTNN